MTSILVTYGSAEELTETVAKRVADRLAERDFDVTTRSVQAVVDLDPAAFDAVLVGTAVADGTLHPGVVAFVERHAETLTARPSGFFQLSLPSSLGLTARQPGGSVAVDTLREATGWEPDRVGRFGARVPSSQSSRPVRSALQLTTLLTGIGRDPAIDDASIKWDHVDDFAVTFGEFVEIQRAATVHDRDVAGAGSRSRLGRAAIALGAFGLAGVVLWAIRNRGLAGGFERFDPELAEVHLPADGPDAAPEVRDVETEVHEEGSDETVEAD